jgi:hypothetical protein
MFVQGRGVEQSDAVATRWFRKAADQGHAQAQHNLGIIASRIHHKSTEAPFFKSGKSKPGFVIRFSDFSGGHQFARQFTRMAEDGSPPAKPPAPANGVATTKTGVMLMPPIRQPTAVSSSTWHLPATAPATSATLVSHSCSLACYWTRVSLVCAGRVQQRGRCC